MAVATGKAWVEKVKRLIMRDPLIQVEFEDRPYRLGELINVSVKIVPPRNINILEGRIDLVHDRRYTVSNRVMVPDYMATRIQMRGSWNFSAKSHQNKVMVPKRVAERLYDRYLHSSTDFVEEAAYHAKTVHSYEASLFINSETPPHCGEGDTEWLLCAVLELPNGRVVRREKAVNISLV